MPPREPELTDKVLKDKNGVPLEGRYYKMIPNFKSPSCYDETEYNHKNGKIHGNVVYPDGLTEEWEDGKFVKVLLIPYDERPVH